MCVAHRQPQDVDTPTAPSNHRFAFGETGGVFHATHAVGLSDAEKLK